MIGWIKGLFLEQHDNQLLLDVRGIGYELEVTAAVLQQPFAKNQTLELYTHFVVREDAQLLYGFSSRQERELFRALIRINGVGPKLALALLSALTLQELVRAVHQKDIAILSTVPGVGRKTAERLAVELKDRLANLGPAIEETPHHAGPVTVRKEVAAALISLGYKPQESSRAMDEVAEEGLDAGEWVRKALQLMARQAEGVN